MVRDAFRGYDPVLGRMNGVDPLASMFASSTPYNYAFNNPIVLNDPSGAAPPKEKYKENSEGGYFKNVIKDYYAGYSMSGVQHITPGSGGHWADGMRSMATNMGLMSTTTFQGFYSVDLSNAEDRDRIVDQIARVVYRAAKGSDNPDNAYVTFPKVHAGVLYGVMVNFIGGRFAGISANRISSSGVALTNAVVLASGIWDLPWPQFYKSNTVSWDINLPYIGDEVRNTSMFVAGSFLNIFGIGATQAVEGGRPMYTGPKNWAGQQAIGKVFGRGLGVAGLALTAMDMYSNGVNTSNSLDAAFGVISFLGLPGAVLGGVYFGANLLTVGISGKTIGEHIDQNFKIVPTVGPLPFMFVNK